MNKEEREKIQAELTKKLKQFEEGHRQLKYMKKEIAALQSKLKT